MLRANYVNYSFVDLQIHVTRSKTSVARRQQPDTDWNVFKSGSLVGLLVGFILWAAIFFPLLLSGII
jgi:hypothetical protein